MVIWNPTPEATELFQFGTTRLLDGTSSDTGGYTWAGNNFWNEDANGYAEAFNVEALSWLPGGNFGVDELRSECGLLISNGVAGPLAYIDSQNFLKFRYWSAQGGSWILVEVVGGTPTNIAVSAGGTPMTGGDIGSLRIFKNGSGGLDAEGYQNGLLRVGPVTLTTSLGAAYMPGIWATTAGTASRLDNFAAYLPASAVPMPKDVLSLESSVHSRATIAR